MHSRYFLDFDMGVLNLGVRIEYEPLPFREVARAANDLQVGEGVLSQARYRYDMVNLGASKLVGSLPDGFVDIARRDRHRLGDERESADPALGRNVARHEISASFS